MNHPLATYLNDHLAGATAAVQLLQHLQAAPRAAHLSNFFTDLLPAVVADRQELETLMAREQISESVPRKVMGWMAEQATQLKLRIDDPAGGALHLLEALEVLAIGIHGKYALWCSLAAAAETCTELRSLDYPRLQQRALEQRRQVELARLETAKAAFCETR